MTHEKLNKLHKTCKKKCDTKSGDKQIECRKKNECDKLQAEGCVAVAAMGRAQVHVSAMLDKLLEKHNVRLDDNSENRGDATFTQRAGGLAKKLFKATKKDESLKKLLDDFKTLSTTLSTFWELESEVAATVDDQSEDPGGIEMEVCKVKQLKEKAKKWAENIQHLYSELKQKKVDDVVKDSWTFVI